MGGAMRAGVFAVLLMTGLAFSTASAWAQDQETAPPVQIPAQGQAAPAPVDPKPADSKKAAEEAEDQAMLRVIGEGVQLMRSGQPRQAIAFFDQVIATYEVRYKDNPDRLYCGSSPAEILAYMLLAASQKPTKSAHAVPNTWGAAYFFKGFSLVELKDLDAAKASLERARDLSPYNPHYLNELANIYKSEKNWPLALETYQAAKEHSAVFAQSKEKEEQVALHGIAFIYSETGKLDEAEAIYKQCLAKNPQDAYAQHELDYVTQQKAKQAQVH